MISLHNFSLRWFYSVAVITRDSEEACSRNPGSSPGRTSFFSHVHAVNRCSASHSASLPTVSKIHPGLLDPFIWLAIEFFCRGAKPTSSYGATGARTVLDSSPRRGREFLRAALHSIGECIACGRLPPAHPFNAFTCWIQVLRSDASFRGLPSLESSCSMRPSRVFDSSHLIRFERGKRGTWKPILDPTGAYFLLRQANTPHRCSRLVLHPESRHHDTSGGTPS